MDRNRVLVSVTVPELDVAGDHGFDIELDLNWEDHDLLSGKTALEDELSASGVDPEQVKSVHLPPGTRTRGRQIGMAATYDNVGALTDFVHGQLDILEDPFLVVHPDKELSYTEQLPLLATIGDLTSHDLAVENTKGAQYWNTPEDMAFYAYTAETRDELDRLHLTVDSAHFTGEQKNGIIDEDGVATVRQAVPEPYQGAVAAYEEVLAEQAAEHEDTLERYNTGDDDPYWPLIRTLVLAGERVKSVHLNDPITNDIPRFTSPQQEPGLYTSVDLMEEHDVYAVLKPGDQIDDPYALRKQEETVRSAYSDRITP